MAEVIQDDCRSDNEPVVHLTDHIKVKTAIENGSVERSNSQLRCSIDRCNQRCDRRNRHLAPFNNPAGLRKRDRGEDECTVRVVKYISGVNPKTGVSR